MPVPETAVHQNDCSVSREYNVGTAWEIAAMKSKPESERVSYSPDD